MNRIEAWGDRMEACLPLVALAVSLLVLLGCLQVMDRLPPVQWTVARWPPARLPYELGSSQDSELVRRRRTPRGPLRVTLAHWWPRERTGWQHAAR